MLKGGIILDGYMIDIEGKCVNPASVAQPLQNINVATAGGYAIVEHGTKSN